MKKPKKITQTRLLDNIPFILLKPVSPA